MDGAAAGRMQAVSEGVDQVVGGFRTATRPLSPGPSPARGEGSQTVATTMCRRRSITSWRRSYGHAPPPPPAPLPQGERGDERLRRRCVGGDRSRRGGVHTATRPPLPRPLSRKGRGETSGCDDDVSEEIDHVVAAFIRPRASPSPPAALPRGERGVKRLRRRCVGGGRSGRGGVHTAMRLAPSPPASLPRGERGVERVIVFVEFRVSSMERDDRSCCLRLSTWL